MAIRLTDLKCIDFDLAGLFVGEKVYKHQANIIGDDLFKSHDINFINTANSFRYPITQQESTSTSISFSTDPEDLDYSDIDAIEIESTIDHETHQNLWNNSNLVAGIYPLTKLAINTYYGISQKTLGVLTNKVGTLYTLSFKLKSLEEDTMTNIGLQCGGLLVKTLYVDGVDKKITPVSNALVYTMSFPKGQEFDFQITLEVTGTLDSISIQINRGLTTATQGVLRSVQLELGSTRTSWKYSLAENPPTVLKYLTRFKVQPQRVKVVSLQVPFETGSALVKESNMLYPRLRLGFPTWSAVYKTGITNASKLLEPLFKPFYDSYSKIVDFSNKIFNDTKFSYQGVEVRKRPTEVYQLSGNTKIPLVEGNLQTGPILLKENSSKTSKDLSRLILKPHEDLSTYDLSYFEGTKLYLRLIDNEAASTMVTIKGIGLNGRYTQESVRIVPMFFTVTLKRFKKILSIENYNNIIVSNHLDCRYDHYLIKNTDISPAIVSEDLTNFRPYLTVTRNESDTRDIINIFEQRNMLAEKVYNFDIEGSKVESIFIDDHLQVYWTADSQLYSSTIYHDLSKKIGHTSNNSNNIVLITNQTTSIGDWAEVKINIEEWGSDPMVVQIKNKDSTLYYNQSTESFSKELVYLYPNTKEKVLELAVKVTNEDPYVFSVFDDKFENVYVASTASNLITSIQKEIASGDLYHYDGALCTLKTGIQEIKAETSLDGIQIDVVPHNAKEFTWSFNISGHKITPHNTTLDSDLFSINSLYGEDNIPVSITLSKSILRYMLNKEKVSVDLAIEVSEQYNNPTNLFTIIVTDNKGSIRKDVSSTGKTTVIFDKDTKEITYASNS